MNTLLNFRAKYPSPPHLTEAQIDDHLIGGLAPAETAHLATCAHCTAMAAEASNSIASFRIMATEWSERRSATLPLPAFTAKRPRWSQRLAVGTAVAAVLTAAVTVPVIRHEERSQTAQTGAAAQGGAQTKSVAEEATIAPTAPTQQRLSAPETISHDDRMLQADNRMLQAIDDELAASVENPSTLGLEPISEERSQQPLVAPLQD